MAAENTSTAASKNLAAIQFSKFYYRTFSENLLAADILTERALTVRALARVWAAEIDGKVLSVEFRQWSKKLQKEMLISDDELNRMAVTWIGGNDEPAAPMAPAPQGEVMVAPIAPQTEFKGLPITERQIDALRAALVETMGPIGKSLADRQRSRAPGNADVEYWIGELAARVDDPTLAVSFRNKAKKAVATA